MRADGSGGADYVLMRVAILLFDDVDVLDVGGPYEVFLTASRLAARDGGPAPFSVHTVSVTDRPVICYGGMTMGPSARLVDAVGSEVIVVPGAVDIDTVASDAAVRSAVTRLAAPAIVASSVCTGAFLLGDAGLLADRPFTTHWEDVDALALRLDAASGQARRARWVDAGSIVTAGGLSSGIAMALHLVDRLADRSLAERTARQLDYEWSPDVGDAATPPASI